MLSDKQIEEFEEMVASLKHWTFLNRADMQENDGKNLAALNDGLVRITRSMRQNQGEIEFSATRKKK